VITAALARVGRAWDDHDVPRTRPGPGQFARDFGLIVAVMLVYFLLRAAPPDRPQFAAEVTEVLIRIQQALGVFIEPTIQRHALKYEWSRDFADGTYAYLHFPVLAAAGVVAWFHSRRLFLQVRDALFYSMVVGLIFYFALPAAPPRLMDELGYDYGFVDTVFGGGSRFEYAQPGFYVNDFAAVPSFHVGWMFLSSMGLWLATRRWYWRVLAVVPTPLIAWASAATANHLFIDMVIGIAIVVACWWLAARRPIGDLWRKAFPARRSQRQPAGQ
jgi:hypothetical protein